MNVNIKLAVKNLLKYKVINSLNLLGLITAFTAFIIIMLYVWTEFRFDRYHANTNELYRIEIQKPDDDKSSVYLSGQTGQLLEDEFSEILSYTTYMPWGKWGELPFKTSNEEGSTIETTEDYGFADKQLTDLFSFDFIYKSSQKPLEQPNTAIISAEFAQKIWGKTQVVGSTFEMDKQNYTVSGVFKNLPVNTVFTAPIILKMPQKGWIAEAFNNWGTINYPQFILVKKGTDPVALNKKINEQSTLYTKYKYYVKKGVKPTIVARPMKDLRFTEGTAESPLFNTNNKTTVMAIGIVGLLVLLIGLINYLNFSVALIPQRIKNVSISRIMGSSRKHLLTTALFESSFLFFLSLLIAFSLFFWLNNSFLPSLIGYQFPIHTSLPLLIGVVVLFILLGIVTGLIPAIKFLKINPVDGIKRYTKRDNKNKGILSVVQFTATIALIAISTLIVKQIHFMQNTDLGFDKNAVLFMKLNDEFKGKVDAFAKELEASPFVERIAFSSRVPGVPSSTNSYRFKDETFSAWSNRVDGNYVNMMQFKMADGRAFISESKAEHGNIICNETAARKFGWQVGDLIEHHGLKKPRPVVGVVKDFNYTALRNEIEPYVFVFVENNRSLYRLSIKLSGANTNETIAFIKKAYDKLQLTTPFEYQFLDEHMNMQYAGENRQAKIITIFSLISLIISLLGILGLSIFAAQRRTKEIGVRKVNGATIAEVLAMLNKSFVKWVAIAFVIATPIAYYAMNKWLENFAYKTTLSWWIFALAGLSALGIALLTVSWQSYRAASRNPVEALRYE